MEKGTSCPPRSIFKTKMLLQMFRTASGAKLVSALLIRSALCADGQRDAAGTEQPQFTCGARLRWRREISPPGARAPPAAFFNDKMF